MKHLINFKIFEKKEEVKKTKAQEMIEEFKKDFHEDYQLTNSTCITCVGEIKQKNLLLLDDNNKEFKLSGRAFEHF